eukprot:CAMPEP_0113309568 /NCGR_PEP_ID=MMETSP0010_2-20120614/7557_1 /TAXON_ID=216773 ORGANISM="Corethron hystrix, Strain 308" /NCGR_SAMPLE_ID=MMETSP0010_2 /ASSEMBLY_ACC=CAM_ASM_000155 /LENGTH=857 /DNA_ID=CAMNT_0000164841 /DNA_START=202 /DNA_END=2779 /DNA_ORIENTATION=- /assembly_acc=CAM_ASM_000155
MITGGFEGLSHISGDITVSNRNVNIVSKLGEGGFSFVYLIREEASRSPADSSGHPVVSGQSGFFQNGGGGEQQQQLLQQQQNEDGWNRMVLKVTAVQNIEQKRICQKEVGLLKRLSHPSIVKFVDASTQAVGKKGFINCILLEYCEGGHLMQQVQDLKVSGKRFEFSQLIIAFGQICNAVSYLHAQKPPITHRDLKLENVLIRNGLYKLCDFGSAIIGHVPLNTSKERADAEDVILKTTTQMYRAPEMVDLFLAPSLTQATDIWALGCCLYSMGFASNCFEESSNLAIINANYKIPQDNSYGPQLVELIGRMLVVNPVERADMTEVIMCLSCLFSKNPLPKRKVSNVVKINNGATKNRVGSFRTDGQGITTQSIPGVVPGVDSPSREPRKLNPNSAAARRRKNRDGSDFSFASIESWEVNSPTNKSPFANQGSVKGDGFSPIISGSRVEGFSTQNTSGVAFDTSFKNQFETSFMSEKNSKSGSDDFFTPFGVNSTSSISNGGSGGVSGFPGFDGKNKIETDAFDFTDMSNNFPFQSSNADVSKSKQRESGGAFSPFGNSTDKYQGSGNGSVMPSAAHQSDAATPKLIESADYFFGSANFQIDALNFSQNGDVATDGHYLAKRCRSCGSLTPVQELSSSFKSATLSSERNVSTPTKVIQFSDDVQISEFRPGERKLHSSPSPRNRIIPQYPLFENDWNTDIFDSDGLSAFFGEDSCFQGGGGKENNNDPQARLNNPQSAPERKQGRRKLGNSTNTTQMKILIPPSPHCKKEFSTPKHFGRKEFASPKRPSENIFSESCDSPYNGPFAPEYSFKSYPGMLSPASTAVSPLGIVENLAMMLVLLLALEENGRTQLHHVPK